MIRIHHSKRARSARVIWLLEELGVPYELIPHEFKPAVLQSSEYLALHPLGQLPVVEDGSVRIFESGAILQYLLEQYGDGRLEPARGDPFRAEYLQWFHYGEASIAAHVTTIVRQRFGRSDETRLEGAITDGRDRLKLGLGVVERALEGKSYVLGDVFTAADIMIAYGIVMAKIIGELPADLPNLTSYLSRLKDRPSYARAWA